MTPYEKERTVEQLTQLNKLVIDQYEKAKERGEKNTLSLSMSNVVAVYVKNEVLAFDFGEDMKKAIDTVHKYIDESETERDRLTAAIDAKRAELEALYDEFERRFPTNDIKRTDG